VIIIFRLYCIIFSNEDINLICTYFNDNVANNAYNKFFKPMKDMLFVANILDNRLHDINLGVSYTLLSTIICYMMTNKL
jgi:hypothetical protein